MRPALLFSLLLMGCPFGAFAQQADDIPTVTLPQIGAGPALLIFVSDYTDAFPPLPGVLKDKPAILATVKQLGFTDLTVLENPKKDAMKKAMSDFGRAAAKTSKASFFYFSGHGVLNNKLNYLIPASAPIETQGHLDLYAVPAEHVTGFVAGKQSTGPCLFFVDACRNNTLPADEKSASGDGVIFQRQAGMFIGYATEEGKISGLTDKGSFFTASLAKRLLTPGRSLDDVFAGVIADVEAAPQREIQPPQKESRLRYVLHLVPAAGDELARLRRENEALKRGTTMLPERAAIPGGTGSVVTRQPPVNSDASGGSILDQGSIGKVIQIKLPGGVEMKFCWCPPGSFTMGSPQSEKNRDDDEDQVEVRLTQGFWMAQTECTQAQWMAVMGSNPSNFQGNDLPVEQVSWEDVQGFISQGNQSGALPRGWRLALPTEAQWEYACRAGTESVFSFGVVLNGEQANCDGNFPYGTTVKGPYLKGTRMVASYMANAWGLYDMHGNVWEWCADAYGAVLPGGTDPIGVPSGAHRVDRGGSYSHYPSNCRAASRGWDKPNRSTHVLGFRPALVRSP